MENPIKMDDLGAPWFLETPIYIQRISVVETATFERLDAFSICPASFVNWTESQRNQFFGDISVAT